MKRVIFYFDGFNFYNGLKEKAQANPDWKKFYWIDFVAFCSQFFPDASLEAVKYFTAPPSNNGQRGRQAALFAANSIRNPEKFLVVKGNYQNKTIECKKCKESFEHPEEKRTDVNIAVHMMLDCFLDKADTLILISADSDQVPAVQAIKEQFPNKTVKIYFPPQRNSAELFAIAKPVVYLDNAESKFKAAVMPAAVTNGTKTYTRPPEWK